MPTERDRSSSRIWKTSLPFISVVIPTYNRREYLKICLDAFARQTYPQNLYDVIVVDDGSMDDTSSFLSEYSKSTPFTLISLRQENQGPAIARNLGIRKARGELVAFTDDDCVVKEDWLYNHSRSFNDDMVGGVGGVVESKVLGIYGLYFDYMGILSPLADAETVYYIITANACYRKDVLMKAGGFNEKIKKPGCEDPILSIKVRQMGYTLRYNPESVVWHYHKNNIKSFARTFYNYGRGKEILDRELNWESLPKRRRYSLVQYKKDEGGTGRAFFFLFLWYLQGIAYRLGCRKGY